MNISRLHPSGYLACHHAALAFLFGSLKHLKHLKRKLAILGVTNGSHRAGCPTLRIKRCQELAIRRPEQLSGAIGREVGEPRFATLRLPELERGTSCASWKHTCGQIRSIRRPGDIVGSHPWNALAGKERLAQTRIPDLDGGCPLLEREHSQASAIKGPGERLLNPVK